MSNSRTVLVTGGAGYIGSHACKALSQAGYTPVTYDNLSYGHEYAVKWGPLEKGGLSDRQRVTEVIRQYQPVAVMHFAAFISAGESVEDPVIYYRNNVAGSLSLLEAIIETDVRKFVFSSTAAVYGMPVETPITESHPKVPINPYGQTKLMIEDMLKDFDRAYGLKSVCLRYFNAAGADPDIEVGEDHDPETHLIPLVLDAAAGKRPHITIYGDDYDTEDGTCIRDYIHVADLASAHVLALQYLEKENESAAYNLGNGAGFSVKEIIEVARRVTEKEIPVQQGDRRPGDPSRLIGDASLAQAELGWKQQYADLDTIINTAWKWHCR